MGFFKMNSFIESRNKRSEDFLKKVMKGLNNHTIKLSKCCNSVLQDDVIYYKEEFFAVKYCTSCYRYKAIHIKFEGV